ncbi:unnamed protein product, partial [Arabidopsis halleri]
FNLVLPKDKKKKKNHFCLSSPLSRENQKTLDGDFDFSSPPPILPCRSCLRSLRFSSGFISSIHFTSPFLLCRFVNISPPPSRVFRLFLNSLSKIRFFKKQSVEEREHVELLMEYQNKRALGESSYSPWCCHGPSLIISRKEMISMPYSDCWCL